MGLAGVAGVADFPHDLTDVDPLTSLHGDTARHHVGKDDVDAFVSTAHDNVIARKVFAVGIGRNLVGQSVSGLGDFAGAGTVDFDAEGRVPRKIRRVEPKGARPCGVQLDNVQGEALGRVYVVVVEDGAGSSVDDMEDTALQWKG